MKIGLDLDDTVNYWMRIYLERFQSPKSSEEITKNVQQILSKDRNFWLTLPIKNRPNFDVELYCTKRVCPKAWSRRYLEIHQLPIAPIYQVFLQSKNKADYIKGRVDVFIDDSVSNFIQMNLSGVPCLLMDSEMNQEWGPIGRIYSLDIEEITEVYNLFINTLYPHFKELL
jgi:hypothetical protein